ncbi:hypothetical protein BI344_18940 [Chromobacterium sphagni]|uniref:Uncharacterized protein n=1 Tax=Chromobacterium sphagni TaxID=1903179 RepID=A0ABX3CA80_9NEIS|nr:hypothetical protein BI344_18940 [Chromobacterium sphagni]
MIDNLNNHISGRSQSIAIVGQMEIAVRYCGRSRNAIQIDGFVQSHIAGLADIDMENFRRIDLWAINTLAFMSHRTNFEYSK